MSIWKEKNPSRKVVPGSSRCPRSHLEVVMALNNHQFLMFMTLEVKSSGRAQWGCLTGNWSSTRWLDVDLFGILFWLWAVSPGSFSWPAGWGWKIQKAPSLPCVCRGWAGGCGPLSLVAQLLCVASWASSERGDLVTG